MLTLEECKKIVEGLISTGDIVVEKYHNSIEVQDNDFNTLVEFPIEDTGVYSSEELKANKIYTEVYEIDSIDFNRWLKENKSVIDNKILEINPNINLKECSYSANTFIGDDWDCYQGELINDDDIEQYKDEPFVVKKEAICSVFYQQYPECNDKSVIIVRS